jgi:hypothetical protein
VKDGTDKLFAKVGNNPPVAIKNGVQIFPGIYPGWETLAAEVVNGQNQVLWKNLGSNTLTLWRTDTNWNLVSSEGVWALNSATALVQETNFQQDFNGNGATGF